MTTDRPIPNGHQFTSAEWLREMLTIEHEDLTDDTTTVYLSAVKAAIASSPGALVQTQAAAPNHRAASQGLVARVDEEPILAPWPLCAACDD